MPSKSKSSLRKRLFLIDGTSFYYRAFYAIRTLTTSRGQPTNAIYGVVAMLRKLLEEEKPEYLAFAFDLEKPTFRHKRYEGYKEHRKPMPEPLISQVPWIKEVLKGFRIAIFEKAGYEADDLLGTLARQAQKEGFEVTVVTSDKDMLQLIDSQVKVYRPTKEGHEIIDEKALLQKWGVTPSQVVEVMSLMGDASDEIPGVPGIGEKTALELIQQFGSTDKLLQNLDQVKGESRRKTIEQNQKLLTLSRELATIDTQVPISMDWQELKVQDPDLEALYRLFSELEFRSLAKVFAPTACTSTVEVALLQEVSELKREISSAQTLSLVLGCQQVAWSTKPGKAQVTSREDSLWKELFRTSGIHRVCPHLKETLLFLMKEGISPTGTWSDPCLSSYLLDPARASHELEALAQEFLNEMIEHPDPIQSIGLQAEAALRLQAPLEQKIQANQMSQLLEEIELPLAQVLARMEFYGICVDRQEIERLNQTISHRLKKLTQEIYDQAGEEFNINSPKQLSQILFEKLKLPIIKKIKTGASTDEEVLRRLSHHHALPATLVEYRELSKLNSTYVEPLPKLIDPRDGKIHTSFNQTVTATGRLSSSNPNLQNIPVRTELGRQIRKIFVPSEKGRVFLAADYSQIELRILAHLSQDEGLCEAFRGGQDIHRVTAAQVFQTSPAHIQDAQRSIAKTINFGIVYGMSAFGLSKELEIDPGQAGEFIRAYFAKYPGVRAYLDRSLEETRQRGWCATLFNRRRYVPELHSKDVALRQFAERIAVNAPIQGSAADLIKIAMVALDRFILDRKLKSRMILTVHDELIFEVPSEELELMEETVRKIMEAPVLSGKPIQMSVPIVVNVKVGNNWLEASHA